MICIDNKKYKIQTSQQQPDQIKIILDSTPQDDFVGEVKDQLVNKGKEYIKGLLSGGRSYDGGCSQNVRNMYNDFYKQIDQKYVAGFKQFFTYVPDQDRELMNRYAKGEYGQKFDQIYNQYKDSITGGNSLRLEDLDNENDEQIVGGEINQQALNENTDFTKVSPEQRRTIEECFNVSPEEAINYRNEEMLADRELFTGGDRDVNELQAYQSMRMKHHISISDDFISSYLNGGQCYTIDQSPDQEAMQQNRQVMNKYSKRKYKLGGFSDSNVQPLIQDNTLTIPYHQDAIQTTTNSQVPSQAVDNANTNMQEQQTALQQQAINEQLSGGKRRKGGQEEVKQEEVKQEEVKQEEDSTSIDTSSISSSEDDDDNDNDNGELLFDGGDDEKMVENSNNENEGFVFM